MPDVSLLLSVQKLRKALENKAVQTSKSGSDPPNHLQSDKRMEWEDTSITALKNNLGE